MVDHDELARVGQVGEAQGWDDDPLSIQPTARWARKFRLIVRVLLVLSAVWLSWSLWEYQSHGGWGLNMADPGGFASLVISAVLFVTLLLLEVLAPLVVPDPKRIRRRFAWISVVTSLLCVAGIGAGNMPVPTRDRPSAQHSS